MFEEGFSLSPRKAEVDDQAQTYNQSELNCLFFFGVIKFLQSFPDRMNKLQ
jgi:hypothetical protein